MPRSCRDSAEDPSGLGTSENAVFFCLRGVYRTRRDFEIESRLCVQNGCSANLHLQRTNSFEFHVQGQSASSSTWVRAGAAGASSTRQRSTPVNTRCQPPPRVAVFILDKILRGLHPKVVLGNPTQPSTRVAQHESSPRAPRQF